jgi:hypothetical protein
VKILVDPRDLNAYIAMGMLSGFSYSEPHIGGVAHVTHFAPKLTCQRPGPAGISTLALHYQKGEQEQEAKA